jgi:hypothetical protein
MLDPEEVRHNVATRIFDDVTSSGQLGQWRQKVDSSGLGKQALMAPKDKVVKSNV